LPDRGDPGEVGVVAQDVLEAARAHDGHVDPRSGVDLLHAHVDGRAVAGGEVAERADDQAVAA
jgi:hypothetical protein